MVATVSVTIGGLSVKVSPNSFFEKVDFIGTDRDDWIGTSGHRRIHFSKGSVKTWPFTCIEDAKTVAWDDSAAKQCRYWLWHNTIVEFVLQFGTSGVIHNISINVYVMACDVSYDEATSTRYFNVQLMEA